MNGSPCQIGCKASAVVKFVLQGLHSIYRWRKQDIAKTNTSSPVAKLHFKSIEHQLLWANMQLVDSRKESIRLQRPMKATAVSWHQFTSEKNNWLALVSYLWASISSLQEQYSCIIMIRNLRVMITVTVQSVLPKKINCKRCIRLLQDEDAVIYLQKSEHLAQISLLFLKHCFWLPSYTYFCDNREVWNWFFSILLVTVTCGLSTHLSVY